jgi:hypothetical protein
MLHRLNRTLLFATMVAMGLGCRSAAKRSGTAELTEENLEPKAVSAEAGASDAFTIEKAEYIAKVQRGLDALDGTLRSLESRADAGSARTAGRAMRAELEAHRRALVSETMAIQNASAEDWPALKAKVDGELREASRSPAAASTHRHAPEPPASTTAVTPGNPAPHNTFEPAIPPGALPPPTTTAPPSTPPEMMPRPRR